jgi:DNA polymerase delta subunit 4
VEERERAARAFDMDMRYGPCLGLTRAQRLRRAAALGLAPPPALLAHCNDDQPCLWEGRV